MKLTKQELDPALVVEIESGGNTKPGIPIEVQITRGSQLVAVPMDSPINVLNFEGKTVINYAPLFDSGLWGSLYGNKYVLNSPSKVTLTADADHQYYGIGVDVKADTDYSLGVKHNGKIGIYTGDGNTAISPYTTNHQLTFNSGANTVIRVLLSNIGLGNGIFTFEDVMLNEGTVAQEFVANVKGVTNPTIENTTTGDALTVVGTFHTGDIVDVANKKVTRAKREVVLDGSLSYATGTQNTSAKSAKVSIANVKNPKLVKYNGKVITAQSGTPVGDTLDFTATDFYISIANTDTGFGPNYSPTVDEWKAYFDGWRMFNNSTPAVNGIPVEYNGTGAKAWHRWDGSTGAYTDIQSSLPTHQAPKTGRWQPYRLLHDLATPVTESSETIGSLRLASGDNTVELTEGRIVNERVTTLERSDVYGVYFLNGFGAPSNNKIKSILEIRKNGLVDKSWTIDKSAQANIPIRGEELAFIPMSEYDPTAIYEVSYIPQEPYKISAHTNPIDISYRDTLGGVSEELVKNVSQLDSRLSEQQNEISSIIPIAKASGGDFAKAYGLGTYAHNLGNGYDLNNVTGPLASNGLFMGDGFVNGPPGIGWSFIENMRHNPVYGKQIAHNFSGNEESLGKTLERVQNNGVWEPWEEKGGGSGGAGKEKFFNLEMYDPNHHNLQYLRLDATGYKDVEIRFTQCSRHTDAADRTAYPITIQLGTTGGATQHVKRTVASGTWNQSDNTGSNVILFTSKAPLTGWGATKWSGVVHIDTLSLRYDSYSQFFNTGAYRTTPPPDGLLIETITEWWFGRTVTSEMTFANPAGPGTGTRDIVRPLSDIYIAFGTGTGLGRGTIEAWGTPIES